MSSKHCQKSASNSYQDQAGQQKGAVAERWAAPRLSLFDSLREAPLPERAAPQKKGYLLKWDLDITRFHTEDLVCPSQRPASLVQWEQLLVLAACQMAAKQHKHSLPHTAACALEAVDTHHNASCGCKSLGLNDTLG